MNEEEIVIVGAARTPVGSFNGALRACRPMNSARSPSAALERAKVDAAECREVVLGQVLTANQGMNPARQAALAAGVPVDATAWA